MTTKYLLIGGCGFIGSHLVRALVHLGKTVTSLDRNDVLGDRKVDGVRYVSGDYGDKSLIETLLAEHDEVIHLAYATRPNTSFDDPLADFLQNLSPAVQLFELPAKYNVLCQTLSDFEFIIDDGSKGDSANIVRSHNDARINLISQGNSGLAIALKRGARLAKSVLMKSEVARSPVYLKLKLMQLIAKSKDVNQLEAIQANAYCYGNGMVKNTMHQFRPQK
tara:strand:- start:1880 stop:2542 length:663 start_codon:yes stop_codon:yes gene_type:complete